MASLAAGTDPDGANAAVVRTACVLHGGAGGVTRPSTNGIGETCRDDEAKEPTGRGQFQAVAGRN